MHEHALRVVTRRRIHRRHVERHEVAEHLILRAQLLVHGIREVSVRRRDQAQVGGVGDIKPLEQQLFCDGKDCRVGPNR